MVDTIFDRDLFNKGAEDKPKSYLALILIISGTVVFLVFCGFVAMCAKKKYDLEKAVGYSYSPVMDKKSLKKNEKLQKPKLETPGLGLNQSQ